MCSRRTVSSPPRSSGAGAAGDGLPLKGQGAPAIIFAELDFETLDDKTPRKLFVGMTRARLKLILVVSERAARVLRAALGGN